MALNSGQQRALANDATFRSRVKSALSIVAFQVAAEGSGVANHATRLAYARNAIQSLDAVAGQISQFIVGRTNVLSSNLTTDTSTGVPILVTDATDAALQSQIATDWDFLAGVAV